MAKNLFGSYINKKLKTDTHAHTKVYKEIHNLWSKTAIEYRNSKTFLFDSIKGNRDKIFKRKWNKELTLLSKKISDSPTMQRHFKLWVKGPHYEIPNWASVEEIIKERNEAFENLMPRIKIIDLTEHLKQLEKTR